MTRDYTGDLHRNVEWQLREAHRAARVRSDLRAEDIDDQVGEPIDDTGLPPEPRRGIHHAEDPRPRGDSIEIAELTLQASKYRQAGESRCVIGLLFGDFKTHLAERRRERAVRVGGSMA